MSNTNSQACSCNACHHASMWGVEAPEDCEKVEEVEEEVEECWEEESWDEYSECTRCGNDYYRSEGHRGWGWCRDCEEEGERLADELEDRECGICGRKGEGFNCNDCRRYENEQGYDDEEEEE